MIANFWPQRFRDLFGGVWPRIYCCIDVESTGYSFDKDVITEFGHCLVQDGKVIDNVSVVLNWTNHDIVPDHWLRGRLDSLRFNMNASGKTLHTDYAVMQKEGMDPRKGLLFMRDFIKTLQDKGVIFVAHNGTFDEKMIAANFGGFKIAPSFSFGDNGLLDTEGIEKASQCLKNERVYPRKNDTLRDYFHRVRYTRVTGVVSNMEFCCKKYKFAEKHGLDLKTLHGAKVDSYCCHLLMQEFGAMLTAPQESMFTTDDPRRAYRSMFNGPTAGRPRVRGQRRS